MRGIHRWTLNSPHKGPITRKMFPYDDVIKYDGRHLISNVKYDTGWGNVLHPIKVGFYENWFEEAAKCSETAHGPLGSIGFRHVHGSMITIIIGFLILNSKFQNFFLLKMESAKCLTRLPRKSRIQGKVTVLQSILFELHGIFKYLSVVFDIMLTCYYDMHGLLLVHCGAEFGKRKFHIRRSETVHCKKCVYGFLGHPLSNAYLTSC